MERLTSSMEKPTEEHVDRVQFEVITGTIDLIPEIDNHQLGHGDIERIDTQNFRKCSVTIRVVDLRRCYFADGRGRGKREARVMVLEFEFGKQARGSDRRITDLEIDIMFDELIVDEGQKRSSPPTAIAESPEILWKRTYPRSAKESGGVRQLSQTSAATLAPTLMGQSLGALNLGKTITETERVAARFSTSQGGDLSVHLVLHEDKVQKEGIPDLLRCAILLQTDGLPFAVELNFKAKTPFLGTRLRPRGTLNFSVDQNYLWTRTSDDINQPFCEDADSKEFDIWILSKTQNSWATE